MNWQEFAAVAPDLAALGAHRFEQTGLALVGTLRRDGWPRISPVEPFIVEGVLLLGMSWKSRKAGDFLRDSRLTVHSATFNCEGIEGDFKLYGRGVSVMNPTLRKWNEDAVEAKIAWRPKDPYHLFAVDIVSAAFLVLVKSVTDCAGLPSCGLKRWTI